MNGLAVCAGVGGLEIGLRLALGDAYRTVCYCEREAYAASVLVARMEDTAMDRAPIWDDIQTFDGRPWRGRVDLISAGFPCQPASHAGQRRGTADDRWLWPEISRVIREVGPRLVFLENVRGLVTVNDGAAFGEILGDLASLGFDAEWDIFTAAEVGAPHQRARIFALAHAHLVNGLGLGGVLDRERTAYGHHADGLHPELADAARISEREPHDKAGGDAREQPWLNARGRGGDMAELADAASANGRTRLGRLEALARAGWSRRPAGDGDALGDALGADVAQRESRPVPQSLPTAFPPSPSQRDAWERVLAERPDLAPALESSVRGLDPRMASRVDRLRVAGNGVVPLVAGLAFIALARRAGVMR